MGGIDALAFTGGIGEHSPGTRRRCAERMEHLGIVLDDARNRDARVDDAGGCQDVAAEGSRVRVLVIRADEETQMARETAALLAAMR